MLEFVLVDFGVIFISDFLYRKEMYSVNLKKLQYLIFWDCNINYYWLKKCFPICWGCFNKQYKALNRWQGKYTLLVHSSLLSEPCLPLTPELFPITPTVSGRPHWLGLSAITCLVTDWTLASTSYISCFLGPLHYAPLSISSFNSVGAFFLLMVPALICQCWILQHVLETLVLKL